MIHTAVRRLVAASAFVFLLHCPVFSAPPSVPVSVLMSVPMSVMDESILPAPDADGRWGYVDAKTGKTLIAPQFSAAGFFHDRVAIVSRAYPDEAYDAKTYEGGTVRVTPQRQGLVGRDGREILPARYAISRANSDMYTTWKGTFIPRLFLIKGGKGESIVFHADKGVIVPAGKHEKIRFTEDGGVFCDGDYYEPDGKRHKAPSGCEIGYIEPETGMLRLREKKEGMESLEGVMRRDGSLLVPVKYHDVQAVPKAGIWLASRGDASVKAKAVAAFLTGKAPEIKESDDILTVDVYDATGKVLRSFRARYNPNVSGENYSYKSKGVDHKVNARTGEDVPERVMQAVQERFARPFKEGDKYGYKDAEGTVIVQPVYDSHFYFNAAGLAVVWRDRKYGVIDRTGKEVLPCEYKTVFDELSLSEGKSRRRAKGQGSAADDAKEAVKPEPKDALFRVKRGELWGLYDGAGKELIPIRYGFIHMDMPDLMPGWVDVEGEGRKGRGLVNYRTGQIIPPQYGIVRTYPGFFLAYTTENNKDLYILLDPKGKETGRYQRAEWFEGAQALAAKRDGKYALLDKNGKQLTPFRYDDVFKAEGPFVWGRADKKEVLLDGKGKEYKIQ